MMDPCVLLSVIMYVCCTNLWGHPCIRPNSCCLPLGVLQMPSRTKVTDLQNIYQSTIYNKVHIRIQILFTHNFLPILSLHLKHYKTILPIWNYHNSIYTHEEEMRLSGSRSTYLCCQCGCEDNCRDRVWSSQDRYFQIMLHACNLFEKWCANTSVYGNAFPSEVYTVLMSH